MPDMTTSASKEVFFTGVKSDGWKERMRAGELPGKPSKVVNRAKQNNILLARLLMDASCRYYVEDNEEK